MLNLMVSYEGYLNPNIEKAWEEWVQTPVGEDIFKECLRDVWGYEEIDTEDYFLRFWVSLKRYPEGVGGNSRPMKNSYVELVELLGYPLEVNYEDPIIKTNFSLMREAKALSNVGDVQWKSDASASIKQIHKLINKIPKKILNIPYFPLLNIQSVFDLLFKSSLLNDEEIRDMRKIEGFQNLSNRDSFPQTIRVLPMAFFMTSSYFMPLMNWRKIPF